MKSAQFSNDSTFIRILFLTLIWVGFLGVRFEVGRGGKGGKITPCLKLVRIMQETSSLARKYTHIFSFRKYLLVPMPS